MKGFPTQTGCLGDDDALNLYKDCQWGGGWAVVVGGGQMSQPNNQLLTFLITVSYFCGSSSVVFFLTNSNFSLKIPINHLGDKY